MEDLKSFVIANVKPEIYYKSVFPSWNEKSRPNQLCLWHDDKQPSLSISLNNGGAKCHACGKRIGNIVHFEAQRLDIDEKQAALKVYARFIHRIVDTKRIQSYCTTLRTESYEWIRLDTGLSRETVEKFNLGIDEKSKRIIIPIKDRFGSYTNLRHYQLPRHRTASTKVKIFNHTVKDVEGNIVESYGYNELFPWQEILKYTPDKPLFMMKAEKDTMLAIQDGLQAFCVTNGELAWSEEWDNLFEEYEIGICLDQDKTGKAATAKKLAILQGKCKRVVAITLPTKQKDYCDWRLLGAGTAKTFIEIYGKSKKSATISSHPSEKIADSQPQLPEYYSNEYQNIVDIGRNSDMHNLLVKVKGIVTAKTDKTYSIPYKFFVGSTSSPKRIWSIPFGRELLRLIKSNDEEIIEFIRRDLLEKRDNSRLTIEPIDYITVTEVEIIPIASVESDSPYVTQKCFYFGKHIDANVPYHIDLIPTTEIRTQECIGIIINVLAISNSIDQFAFSDTTLSELETFKVKDGESWEKLIEFSSQVAAQFSPIRGRLDWHIVALLSWASPLQFEFPNEGLQRGWINTLALGDTETGKSKVTQSLQKLFNCGVFVNAENCTYVGLVGGAIKTSGGSFMLRWGRIPLSNRQLVVVEELSGLSIEQISNMSEVRSSGIARLDKGGLSAETSSKTRLICLSNVRSISKSLAEYPNGVKAIQELIGHGEDIARFDLICTLTNKEVPAHIINQNLYEQETFAILQEDSLRKLIQFIWALKPKQIRISKKCYLHCLGVTQDMGTKYHPSCHIFQAASGRLKLARIACAIACLQFSWAGSYIEVRPDHVDAAANLLQMLYDKPSFGYKELSEQSYYKENITSESYLITAFNQIFPSSETKRVIISYLLSSSQFSRDELCATGRISLTQADNFIGRMIGSNLVGKGIANTWEVKPIGRVWLHKQQVEKGYGVRKIEKNKSMLGILQGKQNATGN